MHIFLCNVIWYLKCLQHINIYIIKVQYNSEMMMTQVWSNILRHYSIRLPLMILLYRRYITWNIVTRNTVHLQAGVGFSLLTKAVQTGPRKVTTVRGSTESITEGMGTSMFC